MNIGFSITYVIIGNDNSWFSCVVLMEMFQLKGRNLMIQKREGPRQACGPWEDKHEEVLFGSYFLSGMEAMSSRESKTGKRGLEG